MFDIVIRNGTLVDGSGGPPWADVRIIGDRTVNFSEAALSTASAEPDAHGMLVEPGFLDVHSHYDCDPAWNLRLAALTSHGVIHNGQVTRRDDIAKGLSPGRLRPGSQPAPLLG